MILFADLICAYCLDEVQRHSDEMTLGTFSAAERYWTHVNDGTPVCEPETAK